MTNDVSSASAAYASQVTKPTKTEEASKSKAYGKTYGNPQLSDKASKYYDELKSKFKGMDFVLVSKDKKDEAKANAAKFGNPGKTVVLIDEEKLEKMASDEKYKKQIEGVIENAGKQLPQLQAQLQSQTGGALKSVGMQINDNGTASYFAVIDKSMQAQRERIEKKAEDKKEAKRAEKRHEAKEAAKERLEKSKESNPSDEITITASSIEELTKKISDTVLSLRSDSIMTPEEKQVGQSIDFKG